MTVPKDGEVIDLADLKQDPKNPRKHSVRNIGLITDALREVGSGRSLLIDASGEIIAGNGVQEAAAIAGISKVKIVDAEADTLIAVRRKDLKGKKKRRASLLDNRAGELADWDSEVLEKIAAEDELLLSGLFEGQEWDRIMGNSGSESDETIPEMELQPFEHYDYIVLMFKNQLDFLGAISKLKIKKVGYTVGEKKRKIGLGRVVDGAKILAMIPD